MAITTCKVCGNVYETTEEDANIAYVLCGGRVMYEPLFCECCGKSIEELRKEIEENGVLVREGSKQLKCGNHYLRENGDVYTTSIYMNYCSDCGAKLEYEDYKLIYESHPWGSTTATETLIGGYRCHACGFETEV